MNDTESEIEIFDDETPEEKFQRVASKRVNRILGDLAMLEQMTDSSNYKFSLDGIEVMLTSIDTAVDRVRQRYTLKLTRTKPAAARHSFRFPAGKE